jgi:hypothetical protein
MMVFPAGNGQPGATKRGKGAVKCSPEGVGWGRGARLGGGLGWPKATP